MEYKYNANVLFKFSGKVFPANFHHVINLHRYSQNMHDNMRVQNRFLRFCQRLN